MKWFDNWKHGMKLELEFWKSNPEFPVMAAIFILVGLYYIIKDLIN